MGEPACAGSLVLWGSGDRGLGPRDQELNAMGRGNRRRLIAPCYRKGIQDMAQLGAPLADVEKISDFSYKRVRVDGVSAVGQIDGLVG